MLLIWIQKFKLVNCNADITKCFQSMTEIQGITSVGHIRRVMVCIVKMGQSRLGSGVSGECGVADCLSAPKGITPWHCAASSGNRQTTKICRVKAGYMLYIWQVISFKNFKILHLLQQYINIGISANRQTISCVSCDIDTLWYSDSV